MSSSTSRACARCARRGRMSGSASTPTRAMCRDTLRPTLCRHWSTQRVSLLEQPCQRGHEARSRRHRRTLIPVRRRRKHPGPRRTRGARRPLRCRQHQARQVRRPDRRPDDGRARARARHAGDGRQHGRHQPRDGAGLRARAALRRRRSRRADLPRARPHARRASTRTA